jgi:DNA-binding NtrC family response regulator
MIDLPSSNRSTILVVEDEDIERVAAVEIIHSAGFDAIEVSTGAEAVLALEGLNSIRILITDIDLKTSISGIVLAACVDHRWPAVGIIMTSGNVRPRPGDVPNKARFLPKPYTAAKMLAAIRGMVRDRAT